MSTRKLWSTTMLAAYRQRHESRAAVYRYIGEQERHWLAGVLRSPLITIWVDERDGRGWQLYERIDLRERVKS
jgi:hypothetical protein